MSLTAPNAPSAPAETRTKRTRSGLRLFWSTIPSQDHPDSNEDAVLIDTVLDIVAVFDGVGGYEGGEVASRIAAHAVLAIWRRQSETANDLPALRTVMREALLDADRQVRAAVERQPDLTGMATTAIVTKIWETPDHRRLLIHGHVGDSRLYILRARGSLDRVTIDDGILSTHVALGLMSEEEALMIDQAENWNDLDDRQKRYFYQRGLITQAIGGRGEPDVHVGEVEVYPGDRVLVCSDGIHDNLTEAEITQLLRKPGRNDGDTLVRAARRRAQRGLQATMRSKPDDMSAVVVDIAPASVVSAQPRAGKTQPTRRARTTTAKTKPAPKTAPTTKSKTAAGGGKSTKAKTGTAKKGAKSTRSKAGSSAPTK
ncbi:MAG TPA: protein phosphatase 2C domain-containing protein [Ktedonobacterales bacterium]|nr:protein phosphatase 2C domain-containing protein [Ktedonobacterales bacterium]